MSKTITLRLSDEEYERILTSAENEYRPISNFITHVVLDKIAELYYADNVEMTEIKSNEKLSRSLKAGHQDTAKMKGKFVE
ncbi:MAG: CopG family transcriptional regulator [Candidatus Omnitrophota bacterium]|nr:CopG family transcriptional regulator [Candidatus Omnitrophota bacterium]